MPESQRYRYRGTEAIRESIDNRRVTLTDTSSNSTIYDVDTEHPLEQWNYSPDQFCIDTVGFRERDNPFYCVNERSVPPRIIYQADHSYPDPDVPYYVHRNYRTLDEWGPNHHQLALDEPTESDMEFVTRAAGALNPSRANFQAAVFLAELRDLPSLFKGLGDELAENGTLPALLRESGREHLRVNYGWAPMIRDLRTFFNVMDKVRNRMKTLQELRGKGMIRRQFREKDGRGTQIKHSGAIRSNEEHNIGLLPYGGDTIYYETHTEMRTTRWCDIEFKLDIPTNLFAPIDNELWDEAHSLVYGTTIDGPALWQAMPWSWFIDWNTNMSEYITSQANVVGASFSKAVLMKTTERYSVTYPVMDSDPGFNGQWSWTFLPGRLTTVTKERILDIEPGVINTTEAILSDGFRSSILGALAIQKFKLPGRVRF